MIRFKIRFICVEFLESMLRIWIGWEEGIVRLVGDKKE